MHIVQQLEQPLLLFRSSLLNIVQVQPNSPYSVARLLLGERMFCNPCAQTPLPHEKHESGKELALLSCFPGLQTSICTS